MRSAEGHPRTRFTLVELMAVVALIAILAALLLPAATAARDKVRKTECANNLRQILMAAFVYLENNDDTFPPQRHAYDALVYYPDRTLKVSLGGNYQCYLEPYTETFEVFLCPSSRQAEARARFAYDYAGNTLMDGNAYEMFNDRSINGIKQSASDWAYIADTNYEWIEKTAPWRIEARHLRTVNLGYLDGHADSMTPVQINTSPRCFGWPVWVGGLITVP